MAEFGWAIRPQRPFRGFIQTGPSLAASVALDVSFQQVLAVRRMFASLVKPEPSGQARGPLTYHSMTIR
jgi:hypothetical protein